MNGSRIAKSGYSNYTSITRANVDVGAIGRYWDYLIVGTNLAFSAPTYLGSKTIAEADSAKFTHRTKAPGTTQVGDRT